MEELFAKVQTWKQPGQNQQISCDIFIQRYSIDNENQQTTAINMGEYHKHKVEQKKTKACAIKSMCYKTPFI